MIDFSTAKNARTKDIKKNIDFDVKYEEQWVSYTATPDDPISRDVYLELSKGKVAIAPGEEYDWNGNKWMPYTPERIAQIKSMENYDKTQQVKSLTAQIDALNDKIEYGLSANVDEDKAKLLALRKERASLV